MSIKMPRLGAVLACRAQGAPDRLALIERDEQALPLSVQAQLLSLSRSSLYYQPVSPSAAEVALKHRIDEIYTACPFYGSRRITAQLRREGRLINRKAVQRQAGALWAHFTSPQYIQRLLAAEVQISMDGKGRALDNIFTERLWRTVKYEEVYLHDYQTPKQARSGLTAYFDFYNYRRPFG